MWTSELKFFADKALCKIKISQQDSFLSFAEIIELWKNSKDFRQFYISLIADLPFAAIFWESPPITIDTLDKDYEFVAVDSSQLAAVAQNQHAFSDYFARAKTGETVISFENLGGDALLVVPCPVSSANAYMHLCAFVRQAPNDQCHQLLQRLAQEIDKRLTNKPLWINTSGLGIYWLHIRLDSRPKYYTFLPYKLSPNEQGSN